MKNHIHLLIAASLASSIAIAQTQPRQPAITNRAQPLEFTFNGAGTLPCQQVIQALAAPESRFQVEQWLHGYLAAYNHYSYAWNRIQLPAADIMVNYVDRWCQNNQQERLLSAAGQLVRELGGVAPLFK
jgi:hypothetical protein